MLTWAQQQIPDPTTPDLETFKHQAALQQRLTAENKARVREQYGLSEEQALEVALKGLQKGWPMPPVR